MIIDIIIGFLIVIALIILGAMFVGSILDKGFENREDPEVLKKWKEGSKSKKPL